MRVTVADQTQESTVKKSTNKPVYDEVRASCHSWLDIPSLYTNQDGFFFYRRFSTTSTSQKPSCLMNWYNLRYKPAFVKNAHHTTPHHTTPHRITSHHTTPQQTMPHNTTPHNTTPLDTTPHPRHITAHYTTKHHATSHHIHVMSQHTIHNTTKHHATSRHVTSTSRHVPSHITSYCGLTFSKCLTLKCLPLSGFQLPQAEIRRFDWFLWGKYVCSHLAYFHIQTGFTNSQFDYSSCLILAWHWKRVRQSGWVEQITFVCILYRGGMYGVLYC